MKISNIKKKISFIDKLKVYSNEVKKQNFNKIIQLLRQYNFKTKNDLKLAIDYFNSEKPIKVESDYLGWIVSISLTLSSFIEIAYNNETKTIDTTKIAAKTATTCRMITAKMPIRTKSFRFDVLFITTSSF